MKKLLWIYLTVIFLIAPAVSFCQQDQDNLLTQSIQGFVTQVDSVGSLLVISDGSQELRFNVDRATKIQRGIEDIMLDEIESNDPVVVEYYKSADGNLKAVAITDNNAVAGF